MSNEYDDSDIDDEQSEQQGEGNAAKALRKQNSQLKKELDELREKHKQLETSVRQTTIADALESHGASKRLARYVDPEIADSDGVLNWLRENGEDFGWTPTEEPDEGEQEFQSQARRLAEASAQAPEVRTPNILQALQSAKTPAEIDAVYKAAGLPVPNRS